MNMISYFTDATQDHQHATGKEVPSSASRSIATSASPAHECHAQGEKGQQKPDQGTVSISQLKMVFINSDLQWRRVTEGLSQFTLDLIWRRQVQLLEKFRRN